MEYTIKKLPSLAGITTRTLRYWDSIGLLKPKRITSSGYRIYGKEEVDRLQQILFFRELAFSLDEIKELLANEDFDHLNALREHKVRLLEERNRLNTLIDTVEKTISEKEGRLTMTDKEKFAGFKREMIDENEKKYGKEARKLYGDEAVEKSNQKLLNMSEEQYKELTQLTEEILTKLVEAKHQGDPSSPLAQEVAALHKKWLTFFWSSYSKEAHRGLAQTYVDDPRFTAYYDAKEPGCAEFLKDAIFIYTRD